MSERCERPWGGGAGVETPLAVALEAIGIPDGATRVVFIGADGYRREVALAAIRADGSRRVVLPDRKPSFWIKDLAQIEAR